MDSKPPICLYAAKSAWFINSLSLHDMIHMYMFKRPRILNLSILFCFKKIILLFGSELPYIIIITNPNISCMFIIGKYIFSLKVQTCVNCYKWAMNGLYNGLQWCYNNIVHFFNRDPEPARIQNQSDVHFCDN